MCNPTAPYGGSHRVGKLILVVMVWEPWRTPIIVDPTYVLPDYGILLVVRTELTTYDVQTICEPSSR
jgi:hypothetical protein